MNNVVVAINTHEGESRLFRFPTLKYELLKTLVAREYGLDAAIIHKQPFTKKVVIVKDDDSMAVVSKDQLTNLVHFHIIKRTALNKVHVEGIVDNDSLFPKALIKVEEEPTLFHGSDNYVLKKLIVEKMIREVVPQLDDVSPDVQ
eukprot:Platyproteum_vivax@DN7670_c3_g1_i32.p1